MDVFITSTAITSLSPATDILDSVAFYSTVNHFITFIISVIRFSWLCAIAFLILVHTFIGVRV